MSRRSELASAALWAGVGTLILVASWRMDRLGDRGINPWSAPGLTPGVVGLLMVLLALVLGLRAFRQKNQGRADEGAEGTAAQEASPPAEPASWRSAAMALLLCLVFAGVSLGHGLPFAVEAALFIFSFTTLFSWQTWRAENRLVRGLLQTAAVAVLAAGALSWLFESVFLVRLP